MSIALGERQQEMTLLQKLRNVNWLLVLLICVTASYGFAMLYSAAGGSVDPWVTRQSARFGMGLAMMLFVAMVDLRFWMRIAYPFYGLALCLLIAVDVIGTIGGGAQRWLSLGFVSLQPSELMKVALILTLARYYHGLTPEDVGRLRYLFQPFLLMLMPVGLVVIQPDLGTAILLLMGGLTVMLLAGVRWWVFGTLAAGALAAMPVFWANLRDYQKDRVFTFLNPERDPLGTGYHIMQSKIALGSGGVWGKGFMQGTQSHLNFLPEKQTDFIFTTLAEEMGMVGGLLLIALYIGILILGFAIALRARHTFGRLLAGGLITVFFVYLFINIAMVMGLLPVVGVPLPLISYGGSAMVTILLGFGFILSVYVHRDLQIPKRPGGDPF